MKKSFVFCFLILLSIITYGQTPMSGDINAHITTIINNLPGVDGDDYDEPSNTELADWTIMLNNVLSKNYTTANTQANALGYDLIAFTDNGKLYYLLEEQNSSNNYWGTYIINPNYCRDVVLQSPHPRKDLNTGKEGIFLFHKLNALAFMLSGTNRCNSTTTSSCSGTTSVCSGSSESYRITDQAHVTHSIFQKTTEVLMNFSTTATFVQLHGFTKLSSDPYLIISNGTRVTPSNDPIPAFKTGLENADPTLTFKIAHIDQSWTRLLGFWNTQGRLLNNSSNHCNTNATNSVGRFIHVEQEKTRLRNDSTGWNKVYAGLINAFGCTVNTHQIETSSSFKIFPNPFHDVITIQHSSNITYSIMLYDNLGRKVELMENITTSSFQYHTSHLENGIYYMVLRNLNGKIIGKEVLIK